MGVLLRASACFLLLHVASAQSAERWPPAATQLQREFPGARIAQRLDADLNGDGKQDVVLSLAYDDAPDCDAFRAVDVLWGHRHGAPAGDDDDGEGQGSLNLPSSPLGTPTLRFDKGVLLVEDLIGGTTATQTTYRYRYDKDADDLRLIGLDTERYSRTGSHGSLRLSWNVVTGVKLVQRSTVGKDGALRYGKEQRSVDKSRTYYYIADTPAPDELLDALVQ
jgi:hypothetical protein